MRGDPVPARLSARWVQLLVKTRHLMRPTHESRTRDGGHHKAKGARASDLDEVTALMRLDIHVTTPELAVTVLGGVPVSELSERTATRSDPVAVTEAEGEALLTEVYTRYATALHSYAFRLLGNQEDADDVTQEVFIRVHGRLAQLRDPARLRPWLYRIATNLCMDQLRRRSRVRRIFGIAVNIDPTDRENDEPGQHEIAHPTSTAGIDGVVERDHIARALRRMPPKYATCLVLHTAQGLSYREIAEILGITTGAAAVRLARARDMFARCYDELKEEGTL